MIPKNKKLYAALKQKAKKKFDAWPSAYASAWLVREYKKKGGKFERSSPAKRKSGGLKRWFDEEWIDVCELPKVVPCGRTSPSKPYPFCRPQRKINKKTPRLSSTLSKNEIRKLCKKKQKSPFKRLQIRRKSPAGRRRKSPAGRRRKSPAGRRGKTD
ncbi:MAG: hypothetical protein K0U52_10370 [Gammaproteobacteria bacterium]|nr:hypothetical protein [Gammaproteobacteria bacterium]